MRLRVSLTTALTCLAFSVTFGGCVGGGAAMSQWVKDQGGVDVTPQRVRRAQGVADRLAAGNPELKVRVCVLAMRAPSAFSWPDHSVFVTRGLLDRATDDELAAAIAHELGHLLNDGHAHAAFGLHGDQHLDAEARADATGVELLAARNISATAMPTMLAKVRDGGNLPEFRRQALRQRIELLNSPH